jgi:GYF domain 2
MQIFIHKNGQQFGPFEKPAVIEMIAKSELTKDDWIFREFDTEWSKVGSLYKTINPVIIKFTLESGLLINWQLSSYKPIDIIYFKLPAETISRDNFRKRYLGEFYDQWFGKNWRDGNEDDSRYEILSEEIEILLPEELAKADWRQPDSRVYLIKNEIIEKVELSEFDNFPLIVQKIKKTIATN